eukprot:gb/GEZN01009988.1/.p1 GENE.gb/GEZN01009988.1/~~gb/GEZN01009988.1/.p1  ORF type:complete len:144 (+),score=8.09 gb/GEZN01009988.1/:103-534(+)
MVVTHIVLLKLDPTNPEVLPKLVGAGTLLKTIPGVLSIDMGKADHNIYPGYESRAQGYTYYVKVEFESREALRIYADHEIHQKVTAECLLPYIPKGAGAAIVVLDWENPNPSVFARTPSWLWAFSVGLAAGFGLMTLSLRKAK